MARQGIKDRIKIICEYAVKIILQIPIYYKHSKLFNGHNNKLFVRKLWYFDFKAPEDIF